jgi:hypothetical protein
MSIRLGLMFILPQAKYHFNGDETYANLVWDDLFFIKPTEDEVNMALKYALMSANSDYRMDRAKHYPSPAEQLQMIYDLGIDGWKNQILNVKNNIPKPNVS